MKLKSDLAEKLEKESKLQTLLEWLIILMQRLDSLKPGTNEQEHQIAQNELENIKTEIDSKLPEIESLQSVRSSVIQRISPVSHCHTGKTK